MVDILSNSLVGDKSKVLKKKVDYVVAILKNEVESVPENNFTSNLDDFITNNDFTTDIDIEQQDDDFIEFENSDQSFIEEEKEEEEDFLKKNNFEEKLRE